MKTTQFIFTDADLKGEHMPPRKIYLRKQHIQAQLFKLVQTMLEAL